MAVAPFDKPAVRVWKGCKSFPSGTPQPTTHITAVKLRKRVSSISPFQAVHRRSRKSYRPVEPRRLGCRGCSAQLSC